MEQKGKYYNPKYPDTSNDWTRNWEKSWLLNKDMYLMHRATEDERKRIYKIRMMYRVVLTLPLILILFFSFYKSYEYFVNYQAIKIKFLIFDVCLLLTIALIFKWGDKILLLSAICLFAIPIYLWLKNPTLTGMIIVYLISLSQSAIYVIYLYNLFSLRKFDEFYFCSIYDKLLNEKNDESIVTKENTPNLIKRLGYGFSLVGIADVIASSYYALASRIVISKTQNQLTSIFKIKFFRMSVMYPVLYKYKSKWFESSNDITKPKLFLSNICMIISLISIFVMVWIMTMETAHYILAKFGIYF
ncbi:hypothetical protein [Francisella tularensis]|uniref:hypothetical protein n=1 Tax=Francisella tularensis TaxID=263 RepID=UPI001C0ECA28|nr:hypothetical protein [Francisella tularensis]MBK2110119.1 hypothetical protein [Francisella tularensis subsp. novicida FSC595]